MPEEQRFKTEEPRTRAGIADSLRAGAGQIESGTVELESTTERQRVTIPESPLFEVELERLTDSESRDRRYE